MAAGPICRASPLLGVGGTGRPPCAHEVPRRQHEHKTAHPPTHREPTVTLYLFRGLEAQP